MSDNTDVKHAGTEAAAMPDIEIKDGVIHIRNPQPMLDGTFREFTFGLEQIQGLDLPAILETDESQESAHGEEKADGEAEG